MPSTRRGQCAEDCRCILCRELKGCRMNGAEVQRQVVGSEDTNFILRRAVPFLPKGPPARLRERQEDAKEDYERSSTLEDTSRRGSQAAVNDTRDYKARTPSNDTGKVVAKDVGHKTVIYFGDSNPRPREDRARQPETCVRVTARCNEDREAPLQVQHDETQAVRDPIQKNSNESVEPGESTMENGDPKVVHEIVVSISPSREDVLRIEEDESQLEDYWSLPGDTSGFKADWSFVQQWRLRG